MLLDVANGKTNVNEAFDLINGVQFEDLGFAKPDFARKARKGVSEVIYAQKKTVNQITGIAKSLKNHGQENILITRLEKEKADEIKKEIDLKYFDDARIGIIGKMPENKVGKIVIAAAGTSDIPVAQEAAVTAEMLGNNVVRLYDVGVAGICRLFSYMDEIESANVIIAIAGMEVALASVIGGLAPCPVIGVPTSVGYGTAFGGVTALLSMLNSCSSGVSVSPIQCISLITEYSGKVFAKSCICVKMVLRDASIS